jgi:hypothetical protein
LTGGDESFVALADRHSSNIAGALSGEG